MCLANGTPMLRAGDEFLHTQRGNDNPYNQDNDITWLDWTPTPERAEMFRFTKLAIALRRSHRSFGRSRFWRDDVQWYGARGAADQRPESRSLAYYLDGASQGDTDFYVMINASATPVPFEIQEAGDWLRVIDTSLPSPQDFCAAPDAAPLADPRYLVSARSVVVFQRRRE